MSSLCVKHYGIIIENDLSSTYKDESIKILERHMYVYMYYVPGNSLFFCVFEMIIQENRGEVLELESIIQRHIFRSRSLSHQSNCSSISDTEEDSCPCQNYRYVLYCMY